MPSRTPSLMYSSTRGMHGIIAVNSIIRYINNIIVDKDIQEACLVTALVLKFARVQYGIIILHAYTKRV